MTTFGEIPIRLQVTEMQGRWHRDVLEPGTIGDLLKIWDITNEHEMSEMAQVLRHLRTAVEVLNENGIKVNWNDHSIHPNQ